MKNKATVGDYIAVVVDVFAKVLTGRFVIFLLFFLIASTFTAYKGYHRLKQLDREYNYTASAEYVSFSSDTCSMIVERESLTIAHDLGGFNSWDPSNCAEVMADTQRIKALITKHDLGVRAVARPDTIFLQTMAFFIYICVCIVNLGFPANMTFPKSSFIRICAGWVLISALAFPFTYQNYGTTTMFDGNSMNPIGMTDGRITTDGQWLPLPRTFMGQVMSTHYPESLQ